MKLFDEIIDFLSNDNNDDNIKEIYIMINKKNFINLLKTTPKAKVIKCIINPSIPMNLKNMIFSYINGLNKIEKEEYNDFLMDNIEVKEDDLDNDNNPYELKVLMARKLYNEDIYNVIFNNDVPFYKKRLLIDSIDTSGEFINIFRCNPSRKILEYILDKQLDYNTLKKLIHSKDVSFDIKIKIIDMQINIKNIFSILLSLTDNDPLIDIILDRKKKIIDKYIRGLCGMDAIYALDNQNIPDIIKEQIKSKKNLRINSAIFSALPYDLYQLFLSNNNEYIINKILKYRPLSIKFAISNDKEYLIKVLGRKIIPNELKEFIMKYKEKNIDNIIKNMEYDELLYIFSNENIFLPDEIQKKIIDINKDKIISCCSKNFENLSVLVNNDVSKIAMDIKIINSNMMRQVLIDEKVNKENIIEILNYCWYRGEILEQIISSKRELIDEFIINSIKKGDISLSKIDIIPRLRDILIKLEKNIIFDEIEKLSDEEKYNYLDEFMASKEIKYLILKSFDITSEEIEYYMSLLKNFDAKDVVYYFDRIRYIFSTINVDFDSFIQYGVGSVKYNNWFKELIDIIENDNIQNLSKVKEYLFNNFYDKEKINNNQVYEISCLLETIDLYYGNKNLLLNIANSSDFLSSEDKENILSFSNNNELNTLNDLKEHKKNIYNQYLSKINDNSTNIEQLKEMLNHVMLADSEKILKYIGGSAGIKMIQKSNEKSRSIKNLSSELLMYSRTIEIINNTNNEEGLKTLLAEMLNNPEKSTRIKKHFREFEEKVRMLFEMDSIQNLTRLSDARKKDGVLRDDLGEEFGTGVYDFSDKNYVLYGHVVSKNEDIESIIDGRSSSNKNFISLTPISYKGQKFYWDKNNSIVAYDNIKKGNFICSSISNMATNDKIKPNSSEVKNINREQRGILETSSVCDVNPETLLYREGLKPCGVILPGGRVPTDIEKSWHEKYNLPYIVTQEPEHSIENPKKIFELTDNCIYENDVNAMNDIINILDILDKKVKPIKENNIYTGREIAVFTDAHALYESTFAILEDIKKRDIETIYSLGDNIGFGPSPKEVVDLLDEYNVISVSGNSEYYSTLGVEPFLSYFDNKKQENQIYTNDELGTSRIERLKLYPASIDIILGNEKIALTHFANDIRWDYDVHSTWKYQSTQEDERAKQFLYTNSEDAKKMIDLSINSGKHINELQGYLSAKNDPIFDGKRVTEYDSIIQGHVHFEMTDKLDNTNIFTLRGVAMGFNNEPSDFACYYILKEKKEGSYDIEKVLVPYNKNNLIGTINSSRLPNKSKILKYINA